MLTGNKVVNEAIYAAHAAIYEEIYRVCLEIISIPNREFHFTQVYSPRSYKDGADLLMTAFFFRVNVSCAVISHIHCYCDVVQCIYLLWS